MSALATVALIACATAQVPAAAAVTPAGGDGVVERYARALGDANGSLSVVVRHALAERVLLLARYYELDPRLLAALVSVESAWRPRAVSPVGALGFGQLMPATAASLDVVALEPYENLDGTARYLRRMLNRYPRADMPTRVRLALASYNAGPAAVARYKGVPPYRETQAYVRTVVGRWRHLGATLDGPTALAASTPPERTAAGAHHAHPLAAHELAIRTAPAVDGAAPAAPPGSKRGKHVRKPLRAAEAPRANQRRHMLLAVLPISLPTPAPQPVRWERSHSVLARLLGLRHRAAAAPDVGPVLAAPALAAASDGRY